MEKKVARHCLEIGCFSMSLRLVKTQSVVSPGPANIDALMHQEIAHNVLEESPDLEKKIKANINLYR